MATKQANKLPQSLFRKNLSSSGALANRIDLLEQDVMASYDMKIKGLEGEIRQLNMQLLNLEDMAPDNSTSLKPSTNKDFNSGAWVNKHAELSLDIELKNRELEVYKKNYDRLFVVKEEEE